MPRFLLMTCERGATVPHPTGPVRRYVGKPKAGPRWGADERPIVEVIPDDAAIRKAIANKDKVSLLGETKARDITEARALLQPPARVVVADAPQATAKKKGGES